MHWDLCNVYSHSFCCLSNANLHTHTQEEISSGKIASIDSVYNDVTGQTLLGVGCISVPDLMV